MENNNTRSVNHILELKELIAGPLVATIDADSLSSQRYLSYLFDIAFESYDRQTGEVGKLRMLTFSYESSDINGVSKQKVNIPLLTLVPLPLLQIKEADFEFDIHIVDAVTEEQKQTFSLHKGKILQSRDEESAGDTKLRVSLIPNAGRRTTEGTTQQSLMADMKVRVKMQQADMPGGLSKLLHLTNNNNMQIEEEEQP